jgi:hypothetical protein
MDFSVERAESRGIDLDRWQSQRCADLRRSGCANAIIVAAKIETIFINHCPEIHK